MTDTKDKTLDEILERVKNDYPFGCATNVTDWAETACKMGAMLGFEKGKQAGRDKRYRLADERIKQLNEKIAALEKEVATLRSDNIGIAKAKYVAITDEDTRLMLESLREENARLGELLKEVYPFIGYAFDKAGRPLPASAASGQLKQKIMKALEESK